MKKLLCVLSFMIVMILPYSVYANVFISESNPNVEIVAITDIVISLEGLPEGFSLKDLEIEIFDDRAGILPRVATENRNFSTSVSHLGDTFFLNANIRVLIDRGAVVAFAGLNSASASATGNWFFTSSRLVSSDANQIAIDYTFARQENGGLIFRTLTATFRR